MIDPNTLLSWASELDAFAEKYKWNISGGDLIMLLSVIDVLQEVAGELPDTESERMWADFAAAEEGDQQP